MSEKGSSNWLLALPSNDRGMILNRSESTDTINLRYFRQQRAQKCTVTPFLNSKRGSFIMRHDGIWGFIAGQLNIVQNDVQVEPHLQEIKTKNPLNRQHGNNTEGATARLDFTAKSFWRNGQDAYINVRVTNPLSATAVQVRCTTSTKNKK